MYATNGLADVIGITADQLVGKSFYFCIQENCLREAVKCLESAKANDSIAYLRFWFRDPTQDNRQNSNREDEDDRMTDGNSSGDDDEGGVHLSELMDHDGNANAIISDSSNSMRSSAEPYHPKILDPNSRSSSGNSTDRDGSIQDPIFDQPAGGQSRTSSVSSPDDAHSSSQPWPPEQSQIEMEAVVSCTSDGLVVVLRRAKPFVPHIATTAAETTKRQYADGFFASPWANDPILPNLQNRANPLPNSIQPSQFPVHPTAAQANTAATKGPASEDFMNSIREVAVFAWSLTGINGSLEKYSRGTPSGESIPPNGYPVWDPGSAAGPEVHSSIEHIGNGYNYSPITGVPIERQIQANSDFVNEYHKNMNQDHPYTTPAPANDFYEHPQGQRYGQQITKHLHIMEANGHSNALLNNSHGVQTHDFGNVNQMNGSNGHPNQTQSVSVKQQSQSKAHRSAEKAEYDPYASASYQAPASATPALFQEPHPANRWDVTNVAQPQSNGHSH